MASYINDFSSLEAINTKEINLNEYTLAQERYDERFGLIFFMRSKSSARTLFVKERSSNLPPEHFREISSRLRIANTYLLTIYGVKQIPNSPTFQIYFEEFPTDLQTEIKRHLSEKTRFSEAELYATLYSTVSALSCLEQNGISHDFLTPLNILKFTKEIYKLHDNFTISSKSLLYNHALRGQHLRYVAPELLESLTNKKEKPDPFDPHKADIFALGMCILDAGLLNTEGDFINKKLMILDERSLQQALKRFGDLYSTAMMQILEDMLFPDPSKRPSPTVLYKRLPGRPVIKGEASGKKRKVLDQLINSTSPEKFEMGKDMRGSYASLVDDFQARTSLYGGERGPSYIGVEREPQYEAPRKSSSPQRSTIQYQNTPIGHDTDISRVNVSASIKNDPLLAQFVKKLVDPTYDVRNSPTRVGGERFSNRASYTGDVPRISQSQIQARYSPISQTHYSTIQNEPQRYEHEVRAFSTQDQFASTQKPIYHSSYLPGERSQAQTYAGTYHSNASYGIDNPYSRPGLGSLEGNYEIKSGSPGLRTADYPQYLGTLQGLGDNKPLSKSGIQYGSETDKYVDVQVRTIPHDSNYNKPISKIDEIISKALERSSTNLYLSQQASSAIKPNILDEQNYGGGNQSQPPSSISHQQSAGMTPLGTIFERQSSEDYTTPLANKMTDPKVGNRPLSALEQSQGNQPSPFINATGDNTLLDLVNNQGATQGNV